MWTFLATTMQAQTLLRVLPAHALPEFVFFTSPQSINFSLVYVHVLCICEHMCVCWLSTNAVSNDGGGAILSTQKPDPPRVHNPLPSAPLPSPPLPMAPPMGGAKFLQKKPERHHQALELHGLRGELLSQSVLVCGCVLPYQ